MRDRRGPGSVLLVLALGGSTLLAQARPAADMTSLVSEDPDSARRAIEGLLALAAPADSGSARALLATAGRLAGSYADVWHDSVPGRTVGWYRRADSTQRAGQVVADSLRRAGGIALRADGLAAALRLWRASLAQATRIGDTTGAVAAAANIGIGFYTAGEADSAAAWLEPAYQRALATGDYRAAGTALGTLASIQKDREQYRAASELYRRAAALHERVGDTRGLAAAENNLGLVAAELGDTAGARAAYQRALATNRRFRRTSAAAANLVNLGTLADLQGAYGDAEQCYREALDVYVESGDSLNSGLVLQDLGRLALRRGNYTAAATHLRRALAIHERIGPPASARSVAIDLARAESAAGALQPAVRTLERAERLGAGVGLTGRDRAELALARAEVEARLNHAAAADRRLAVAERYYAASGDPTGQANAREERALLDLRRQAPRSALDHLQQAVRARELAGDVRATAGSRLLLGYAAAELGDTTQARLEYDRSRETFARIGDPVGEAQAMGALAGLALTMRLPLTADSLYRTALRRLGARPVPSVSWWLHLGRGEALRGTGATDAAARELRASIADVERSSGAFVLPENRAAFMADKWQAYGELAELEQERGRPDSAFAVSERMRAQVLLELLTSTPNDRGPAASIVGGVRDLRQRITELTLRLTGDDAEPAAFRGPATPSGSEDAVREALADAEAKYADILGRLRQDATAGGAVAPAAVVSAATVRERLNADEVFLEYLVSDTTSMVFVVTHDTTVALDLHVGRRVLARLIDFARGTIGSDTAGAGQELWRAPLTRLHQYLVAPIEDAGLFHGKERLYIAPHAELHYLPFAALLAPGPTPRFLAQRFAISYAPSASVWARLANQADSRASGSLLAVAPVHRGVLPGTEVEARRIARMYGRHATSLAGADATERQFREVAGGYGIVHLATAGVLNKQNPLFSYVALRPGADEDGRLEVHEIYGLRLQARLVVLSACQTALGSGALGDVPAGDDWVGLVQAFLEAGATRVLATLWPVKDRATASLMGDFYQRLRAGASEDAALAGTQRTALGLRATSSPLYWAGFVLTGAPAARRHP
jgi:CHAT domain-containing protein/tetratricopeptide (TPR) repeat protein